MSGERLRTWFDPLTTGLFLLVAGVRLGVVAWAACPVPYYDQWLAEFNNLFLGISHGEGGMILFTPHNEHVPLTTKLISLAGFVLNGYWDVLFLCVASAFVRAAEAVLLFRLLSSGADGGARKALAVLCAGFFAIPFSGFNWLCGMQVSFYLAELSLLAALYGLRQWRSAASGSAWLVGAMLTGLCSLGSAVTIPVAVPAAHLADGRKRSGFWPAWGATLALAAGYVCWLGRNPGSAGAQESVAERVLFFLRMVSWPIGSAWAGLALLVGVTAMAARLWRTGVTRANGGLAVIAGIGAYGLVNALLIAARRSPSEFHARHVETIGFIALATLALGVWYWNSVPSKSRRALTIAAELAVLAYGLALGRVVVTESLPYIRTAAETREAATAHCRSVLLSGGLEEDITRTNDSLAARNYAFFDDPMGRFSMPPIVGMNILAARAKTVSLLAPEIVPVREPSLTSRIVRGLAGVGWWLAGAGAALGLWGLSKRGRPGELRAE